MSQPFKRECKSSHLNWHWFTWHLCPTFHYLLTAPEGEVSISSTVAFPINSRENFWIFTRRDTAPKRDLVGIYNLFIPSLCDAQLGLRELDISEVHICLKTCSSWHQIHATLCTNQITDPVIPEWTDRNLTLESDSLFLESKYAEQLEIQCFKLLRNVTLLFASPECLTWVSPC